MSPIDRSSLVVGTSSTGIACEQSRFPNSPDWIFGLREPSTSGGSQPISSSSPTYRSRSALLRVSIRLGLGSTKCGSWYPLPRDSTEMRSPPTSLASEPSTGMLETTRSAAHAEEPVARDLQDDLRVEAAIPSGRDPRAVFQVPPDRFGLPRERVITT